MKTSTASFMGCSRSGKGKMFYGIPEKRLALLRDIASDRELSASVNVDCLVEFTCIYIKHARQLAKAGEKDSARDWFRFFRNSQILNLLSSVCPSQKVTQLTEDLNFLGLECHPLDVPAVQTDLESINRCLMEILTHVKEKPFKKETVRQFNKRGASNFRLVFG